MKKTVEELDQDRKDYLKKYIANQNAFVAVLYYLCITHYRCDELGWNSFYNHMDYVVRVRVFNPWNPLSWLLFLISMIGLTLYYVWKNPLRYLFTAEAWKNSSEVWDLFKFD